jgi:hypothetical protein
VQEFSPLPGEMPVGQRGLTIIVEPSQRMPEGQRGLAYLIIYTNPKIPRFKKKRNNILLIFVKD